ncbi:hypothetical protein [Microcoleus sp. D2_18a_B4]|uniref:hypothetical protein n=1 Tax=Microcoleus sp. D2_18a_B4 TaxID=3055329 RepID=UPI002FD310E3
MSNFFTPEFNNESAIAPWNASLEPTKAIIPQLDANRVLTGGVGEEVNLPTLMPEAYDNIILPDDLLTRIASAVSTDSNSSLPDSSVDLVTGQAMSEVYGDLSKFAADPDFAAKLNVAFGENWDAAAAKALAEGWFQGDFSDIPPVKVVSSAEIGGANGAFAATTDTIYLSKEFLAGNAGNPAAVADVLLEEIGHSVDSRLNVTDSPGDEGAIFAAVVQGKELSEGELQGLKSEDDSGTVAIDGYQYLVEKQLSSFPVQGSIGYFYNRNPAIASQLGRATGNEFQFSSGKWRQNFQGGAIFHSANGTFSVRGSLGNYYLNTLGGQNSQLGLPTSEEFQVPNGWRQNFQGGAIFHSGAGSYMARGSLGNYYLNNLGGQNSQLGLPTSNEFQVPNGWRQNFERGYVNWWNTGNGTFTLNNSPSLVSSTQQANSFFKLQYWNPTYNSSGPYSSTNCGPASLAMIRQMFGREQANISDETSIDYARYLMFGYSNGTRQGVPVLNQDTVWTSFDNVKNGIRNSGGTPEELTGWDNLDRSLAAGKPVINYGTLTSAWRGQFPSRVGSGWGGHWNAILGKTSDGKYIVADPMHEGGTVAMTKTQLSVFNANPQFIAFARR